MAHQSPMCVILEAASREGWRTEPRAGPSLQECLAGLGPLTQPRWHLLWEKGFQRHIQNAASDSVGDKGSSLLICSTESISNSKARVPGWVWWDLPYKVMVMGQDPSHVQSCCLP